MCIGMMTLISVKRAASLNIAIEKPARKPTPVNKDWAPSAAIPVDRNVLSAAPNVMYAPAWSADNSC